MAKPATCKLTIDIIENAMRAQDESGVVAEVSIVGDHRTYQLAGVSEDQQVILEVGDLEAVDPTLMPFPGIKARFLGPIDQIDGLSAVEHQGR